ncbi:uncharacterized protein [Dipodomys merriami]|uniref:uncharacterized protein isoform X1 n=1 Tax=Dipodomys merriami TaxID=94247 RepID=UPI003855925C
MEACAELQALLAAPAAPGAEVAGGRPSPCALGACAQSGRGLWPFPLCEVGTWGSRAPASARWAAGGGASAGRAGGAGGWREFPAERAVLCAGADAGCGRGRGGSSSQAANTSEAKRYLISAACTAFPASACGCCQLGTTDKEQKSHTGRTQRTLDGGICNPAKRSPGERTAQRVPSLHSWPVDEEQFGFPAFSGISRLTWLVSLGATEAQKSRNFAWMLLDFPCLQQVTERNCFKEERSVLACFRPLQSRLGCERLVVLRMLGKEARALSGSSGLAPKSPPWPCLQSMC